MWPYIIGFVVVVAIITVIINRRVSTGASRADDLASAYRPHENKGGDSSAAAAVAPVALARAANRASGHAPSGSGPARGAVTGLVPLVRLVRSWFPAPARSKVLA